MLQTKYEPDAPFSINMVCGQRSDGSFIYKERSFGNATEMADFFEGNKVMKGEKKKKKTKKEKPQRMQLVRMKVGNARLLGMTEEEVLKEIQRRRKNKNVEKNS